VDIAVGRPLLVALSAPTLNHFIHGLGRDGGLRSAPRKVAPNISNPLFKTLVVAHIAGID
jgi:hypothetical protein